MHESIPRKGRKTPNATSKRNNKNTKQITSKGNKWCLFDKIMVDNQIGYITGFTGSMAYVQNIEGKYLQLSPKYKQISVDNLILINRNNNWGTQKMAM